MAKVMLTWDQYQALIRLLQSFEAEQLDHLLNCEGFYLKVYRLVAEEEMRRRNEMIRVYSYGAKDA